MPQNTNTNSFYSIYSGRDVDHAIASMVVKVADLNTTDVPTEQDEQGTSRVLDNKIYIVEATRQGDYDRIYHYNTTLQQWCELGATPDGDLKPGSSIVELNSLTIGEDASYVKSIVVDDKGFNIVDASVEGTTLKLI